MNYFIPAKTFLIGEYSALVGGSVLGLATNPGFEVRYSNEISIPIPGSFKFHPQSPAGILQIKNTQKKTPQQDLHNFEFIDHIKTGGFGRSTAEYLSLIIPNLKIKNQKNENYFLKIKKEYQEHAQGIQVSGQDLAIQYFGKVTYFNGSNNNYETLDWKLNNYEFFLVSTGIKVATHEHLQEINLSKIKHFAAFSDPLIGLYFTSAVDFIQGLKEWTQFLKVEKKIIQHSLDLMEILDQDSDILCAKPCGALGADVLLIICQKEKAAHVQHNILSKGLSIKASSVDLALGLKSQLGLGADRILHVD